MVESRSRSRRTRRVSLQPREAELVDTFSELSGLGLTALVREALIPRLPAAVALLRDMRAAGMDIDAPATEVHVVVAESEAERRALYEDSFRPTLPSSRP